MPTERDRRVPRIIDDMPDKRPANVAPPRRLELGDRVVTIVDLDGELDQQHVRVAIGATGVIDDVDGDAYHIVLDDGVVLWTDDGGVIPEGEG